MRFAEKVQEKLKSDESEDLIVYDYVDPASGILVCNLSPFMMK